MPNRHAHRTVPSPAGYASRRTSKEAAFEAQKNGSRSMKKLVRSLSDRYAAVTSPLTCKKKTSCTSGTPSLKTMKTTAATSLLPLTPALSVSCRPVMQSASTRDSLSQPLKPAVSVSCRPAVLAASRKDLSSTVATGLSPSISMSKKLLHMQPLARTGAPVSLPSMHVDIRSPRSKDSEQKKIIMKFPPPHNFQSVIDKDEIPDSVMKKLTEVGLSQAPLLDNRESRHGQTRHALEVLSADHRNRTKLQWQQLEALLIRKNDELESLQTVGLMLKELCMKQDDEIKTLKAAFPATLREVADLRETCQKQEKELAYSRVALPALQAQVTSLSEQLGSLTEELAQIKAQKEASLEKVSSHFHDREASHSSSSCLSMEPSPVTNGFLEHLRHSRRGQNVPTASEDQGPIPARVCDAASSCSSVTSIDQTSEAPVNTMHRRGFSAVLSVEHMLKGSGKRSGRKILTDKDIIDTLQELDNAADREQALLQARCADAVKELRSSSSRFATLEPIKSILTCASPQLHNSSLEKEKPEINRLPKGHMWNLKPT